MNKETISDYETAIRESGTVDLAGLAEKAARRTQYVTWLRDCVVFCDSVTMPAILLHNLRAEAASLRAMGNLQTARSISAAVERHQAARRLMEVDGEVTLGSGRAHNLLTQALNLHRMASEIDIKIHAEEARMALIQDQK